jgi:hypothetical protein
MDTKDEVDAACRGESRCEILCERRWLTALPSSIASRLFNRILERLFDRLFDRQYEHSSDRILDRLSVPLNERILLRSRRLEPTD